MELTTGQLIKIIIGVLVVVVVIGGLFFVANYAYDFFKNIPTGNETKIFMALLK